MTNKSRNLLKIISLGLVLALVSEQGAWAAPELVSALRPSAPLSAALLAEKPWLLEVPTAEASLEEFHRGTNGRLIVHLQDPHSNFGGQENLARVLGGLSEKYPLSLVLSEGGTGDSSLFDLRKELPRKTWQRVAKRWLREARIAGEEYWNLTSERPLDVAGIENLDAYFESVRAYAELAKRREASLDYLRRIRRAIQDLKPRMYPRELVEYERAAADTSKTDKRIELLAAWMESAKSETEAPAFRQMLELRRAEKADPAAVAALEWGSVVAEMDALERKMYAAKLVDRPARVLRSIDRYTRLLEDAFSVHMTSREFAEFEANEKNFATFASLAFLNRRLAEHDLAESLVAYDSILEEGKKDLRRFYASVDARDEAFFKNAEKAMAEKGRSAAFLVAGGYHTEHLKKLFSDKGYSFAVIRPAVTNETNWARYEERLLAPVTKLAAAGPAAKPEIKIDRTSDTARAALLQLMLTNPAFANEAAAFRAEIAAERAAIPAAAHPDKNVRELGNRRAAALVHANKEEIRERRLNTLFEISEQKNMSVERFELFVDYVAGLKDKETGARLSFDADTSGGLAQDAPLVPGFIEALTVERMDHSAALPQELIEQGLVKPSKPLKSIEFTSENILTPDGKPFVIFSRPFVSVTGLFYMLALPGHYRNAAILETGDKSYPFALGVETTSGYTALFYYDKLGRRSINRIIVLDNGRLVGVNRLPRIRPRVTRMSNANSAARLAAGASPRLEVLAQIRLIRERVEDLEVQERILERKSENAPKAADLQVQWEAAQAELENEKGKLAMLVEKLTADEKRILEGGAVEAAPSRPQQLNLFKNGARLATVEEAVAVVGTGDLKASQEGLRRILTEQGFAAVRSETIFRLLQDKRFIFRRFVAEGIASRFHNVREGVEWEVPVTEVLDQLERPSVPNSKITETLRRNKRYALLWALAFLLDSSSGLPASSDAYRQEARKTVDERLRTRAGAFEEKDEDKLRMILNDTGFDLAAGASADLPFFDLLRLIRLRAEHFANYSEIVGDEEKFQWVSDALYVIYPRRFGDRISDILYRSSAARAPQETGRPPAGASSGARLAKGTDKPWESNLLEVLDRAGKNLPFKADPNKDTRGNWRDLRTSTDVIQALRLSALRYITGETDKVHAAAMAQPLGPLRTKMFTGASAAAMKAEKAVRVEIPENIGVILADPAALGVFDGHIEKLKSILDAFAAEIAEAKNTGARLSSQSAAPAEPLTFEMDYVAPSNYDFDVDAVKAIQNDAVLTIARAYVENEEAFEEAFIPFEADGKNVAVRIKKAGDGAVMTFHVLENGVMKMIGRITLSEEYLRQAKQINSKNRASLRPMPMEQARAVVAAYGRSQALLRLADKALVEGDPVVVNVVVDRLSAGEQAYEAIRLQVEDARKSLEKRGEKNVFVQIVLPDGEILDRQDLPETYKTMFVAAPDAALLERAEKLDAGFLSVEAPRAAENEFAFVPYAAAIFAAAAVARAKTVAAGDPLDAALSRLIPLQFESDRLRNFGALLEVKNADLALYSRLMIPAIERFRIEEVLEVLRGARLAVGSSA